MLEEFEKGDITHSILYRASYFPVNIDIRCNGLEQIAPSVLTFLGFQTHYGVANTWLSPSNRGGITSQQPLDCFSLLLEISLTVAWVALTTAFTLGGAVPIRFHFLWIGDKIGINLWWYRAAICAVDYTELQPLSTQLTCLISWGLLLEQWPCIYPQNTGCVYHRRALWASKTQWIMSAPEEKHVTMVIATATAQLWQQRKYDNRIHPLQ